MFDLGRRGENGLGRFFHNILYLKCYQLFVGCDFLTFLSNLQILLLPHPPFKPIYYTLVIMDLCKVCLFSSSTFISMKQLCPVKDNWQLYF